MKAKIHPEALQAVRNFKLPQEIGFGSTMSPIMFISNYSNGNWSELEMKPYGPITLDPTAKVFHYGQEIFEGMKAYRCDGNGPYLFRPDKNWERFNYSARRMVMPEIPKDMWDTAIKGMVQYSADFIPQNSGESLYIRPFMFATEVHLGIKPSTEFLFMVIASPSGSYFNAGELPVLVEREFVRAVEGGTGDAKTGGNYAASLKSAIKARENECLQTLWLDGKTRTKVEEMSGMNFFAVINGKLTTPELTPTILNGITRDSILAIAKNEGIEYVEKALLIDELLEAVDNGTCTEAFACGTAAIITPISSFKDQGREYKVKSDGKNIALTLRQKMLDIQEGRAQGPHGWSIKIPLL